MGLRRLATSNHKLISSNLLRSISGSPSLNRPSPSNVFDPLAPSTRSVTQGQLMNQLTNKCNPFFSASGIMGITGNGAARDVRYALHLNMYQRSFSSSSVIQTEQTKTAETIQPNANITRPLSPHLPIYKPQSNSLASIFNRISGAYLVGVFVVFHLLALKAGPVCFTYYSFYQVMFYSSKLALISAELAVLAVAYHLFHSFPHALSSLKAIVSRTKP